MSSAHGRAAAIVLAIATLWGSAAVVGCARPNPVVIEAVPSTTAPPDDTPAIGPEPTVGPVEANAVVTNVVDGDTIDVRLETSDLAVGRKGVVERIRLIGIDTPEEKKPNTPIECFAIAAAAGTAQLLPVGTAVRLDLDVEPRDRYGRLLAYVIRASDGLFVNLELARAGYAGLLTYPPNVAHTDEFVAAVEAARRNGVGLWARCEGVHEPA